MELFRKRQKLKDRLQIVEVYTLLEDVLHNEDAKRELITKLGEDEYQYIKEVANTVHPPVAVAVDYTAKIYSFFDSYEDLLKYYKTFKMFDKNDRSSFKYWFAHWCGFQLTALNLGAWKFKYLFHDIEKPWMKLLNRGNYKKVQEFHRTHASHHLEYGLKNGFENVDWEALVIDWECCGLSKQCAQLDARETLKYEIERDKWNRHGLIIERYVKDVLEKFCL